MERTDGPAWTIGKLSTVPRLSSAFKRLEQRFAEVAHLQLMARRYSQLRAVINDRDRAAHTNALVRAATVLLSGHIQGYVEDLSDVVVDRLVKDAVSASQIPETLRFHATKSLIRSIKETNDPVALVDKLRNYGSRTDEILRMTGPVSPHLMDSEYKDGFGNPTVEEVGNFFGRFGLNDYRSQMGRRLRREWPIVENAINQIVDRRNKIAHGDAMATLTVLEFSQYMRLARKFASATDRVVTVHFGKKGCKFWPTGIA